MKNKQHLTWGYNEEIQKKEMGGAGGQGCLKYVLALGIQRPTFQGGACSHPCSFPSLWLHFTRREEKHGGIVSMASAGKEWALLPSSRSPHGLGILSSGLGSAGCRGPPVPTLRNTLAFCSQPGTVWGRCRETLVFHPQWHVVEMHTLDF